MYSVYTGALRIETQSTLTKKQPLKYSPEIPLRSIFVGMNWLSMLQKMTSLLTHSLHTLLNTIILIWLPGNNVSTQSVTQEFNCRLKSNATFYFLCFTVYICHVTLVNWQEPSSCTLKSDPLTQHNIVYHYFGELEDCRGCVSFAALNKIP